MGNTLKGHHKGMLKWYDLAVANGQVVYFPRNPPTLQSPLPFENQKAQC